MGGGGTASGQGVTLKLENIARCMMLPEYEAVVVQVTIYLVSKSCMMSHG